MRCLHKAYTLWKCCTVIKMKLQIIVYFLSSHGVSPTHSHFVPNLMEIFKL